MQPRLPLVRFLTPNSTVLNRVADAPLVGHPLIDRDAGGVAGILLDGPQAGQRGHDALLVTGARALLPGLVVHAPQQVQLGLELRQRLEDAVRRETPRRRSCPGASRCRGWCRSTSRTPPAARPGWRPAAGSTAAPGSATAGMARLADLNNVRREKRGWLTAAPPLAAGGGTGIRRSGRWRGSGRAGRAGSRRRSCAGGWSGRRPRPRRGPCTKFSMVVITQSLTCWLLASFSRQLDRPAELAVDVGRLTGARCCRWPCPPRSCASGRCRRSWRSRTRWDPSGRGRRAQLGIDGVLLQQLAGGGAGLGGRRHRPPAPAAARPARCTAGARG